MNRFYLVILMLLLTMSFAFGQNSVEDINGFDWITWSPSQKSGYVQGWMSAYSSVIWLLTYQSGSAMDEAAKESISNHLYIPLNVGQVVNRIDEVYAAYDNRQYKLLEVFMVITGKDFWNQSEERQKDQEESQVSPSL